MLSRLKENSGEAVVMLGSCEGQIKGDAGSRVASLPTGGIINTSLVVHVDLV